MVTLVLFVFVYVLPYMAGLPSGEWKSAVYFILLLFGNLGFMLAVFSLPILMFQLGMSMVYTIINIVRRERRQALICMGCVLVWIPLVTCWHFRLEIEHDRSRAFSNVANQGNLIVAALESNHAENGSYPETLNDLVPSHIDSIPIPGIVASRRFGYSLHEPGSGYEDPYYLAAPIRIQFMDFDALEYSHGYDYDFPIPVYDGWAYFDD